MRRKYFHILMYVNFKYNKEYIEGHTISRLIGGTAGPENFMVNSINQLAFDATSITQKIYIFSEIEKITIQSK